MADTITAFPSDTSTLPDFAPAKPVGAATPFPKDTSRLPEYTPPKTSAPAPAQPPAPPPPEVSVLKDYGNAILKLVGAMGQVKGFRDTLQKDYGHHYREDPSNIEGHGPGMTAYKEPRIATKEQVPEGARPVREALDAVRDEASMAIDLGLSAFGMLVNTTGDALARWGAIAEGVEPRGAAVAVKGALNEAEQRGLSLIHKGLGIGDVRRGVLANAMDQFTKAQKKVSEEGSAYSGNILGAEDFDSVVEGLMAWGVSKGIKSKKTAERVVQGAEEDAKKALAQTDPKKAREVYEPETQEGVASTMAKEGVLTDPFGAPLPPDVEADLARLPPNHLENAKAKAAAGKMTEMTGEERGAYEAWKKEGQNLLPPPKPRVKGSWGPDGKLDTTTKLALGAGLAAGAYYASEGERDKAVAATAGAILMRIPGRRGFGLAEFEALPNDSISHSGIMERSDTTTKTQERLLEVAPGNTSFTKKQVLQEMGKAGATKEEAEVIRGALDRVPGDRVSSRDLMIGVKALAGDFELEGRETKTFADYGLDNIRDSYGPTGWEGVGGVPKELGDTATTTLYKSPPSVNLPPSAHFPEEPNVFGWTRSFEEDGVRKVFEIQTELEKGKVLNEGEKERLRARVEELEPVHKIATEGMRKAGSFGDSSVSRILDGVAALERLPEEVRLSAENGLRSSFGLLASEDPWKYVKEAAEENRGNLSDPDVRGTLHYMEKEIYQALKRVADNAALDIAEAKRKLSTSAGVEQVAPLLETGFAKRLVREELARARHDLDQRLRLEQGYRDLDDPESVSRAEDLAANHPRAVHFADAETVAKVEGWADRSEQRAELLKELESSVASHQTHLDSLLEMERTGEPANDPYYQALRKADPEGYQRVLDSIDLELDGAREGLAQAQQNLARAKENFSGPRFGPRQRIFDRYLGLEKYYKSLGGKHTVDPQGHGWWEVPTPSHGRVSQLGRVDPDFARFLARSAAVGTAAWMMYQYSDDNKLLHALMAGLGTHAVIKSRPLELAKAAFAALKSSPREVNAIMEGRGKQYTQRIWNIDTILAQQKIEKWLPKEADRKALTHAMEKGKAEVAKLPQAMKDAAKFLYDELDARLFAGLDADVLHTAFDSFLRDMWGHKENDPLAVKKFLDSRGVGGPASAPRDLAGHLEAGRKAGLIPKTEDASAIFGMYSNSLIGAVSNKAFMGALKGKVVPSTGLPTIMSSAKAPPDYVSINHPLFVGQRVHPDLEGPLKVLFDTRSAEQLEQAISNVSDVLKRLKVSGSVFHAKTLIEAAVRASSHPLRVLGAVPSIARGTHYWLQEMQKGSDSPRVKDAVASGLMFAVKGAGSEDAGVGFYAAMKSAQKFLNGIVPGAGKAPQGLAWVSRLIDTFMWERLHPALKFIVWDEKSRQLLANSAAEERAGRGRALTQQEADVIAAHHANQVEGGLNYQQIALEAQTRLGRAMAEKAFTQSGRRGMQFAFFAPDWNISAVSILVDAIGTQPGMPNMGTLKGLLKPKDLADLNRQLILRSALYYAIGFNAINLAMSGQFIWENDDPTKVQMGPKGSQHEHVKMQIDKSMFETVNMAMHPEKEFFNKLGTIPSALLEVGFGTEYMAPREDKRTGERTAGPPMRDDLDVHMIKKLLPFTAQDQIEGLKTWEMLANRAGVLQFSGSTPESIAKEKELRAARREKEKRKQDLEEYHRVMSK